MALSRIAMMKNTTVINNSTSARRLAHHFAALPPPISGSIDRAAGAPPPCVLPENNNVRDLDFGFGFPSLPFGEGMEVMAVPKRKVTPHKKGIRNGPKALKPIPVIIRCKSCGRIKLPHFYCCSGDRGKSSENSDRTN